MGQKRDYPNSGTISKNEDKQEPNHADYGGDGCMTCNCGQQMEFWVNGYIKHRNDGSGSFLSLAFKPKQQRQGGGGGQQTPTQQQNDQNDQDELGF